MEYRRKPEAAAVAMPVNNAQGWGPIVGCSRGPLAVEKPQGLLSLYIRYLIFLTQVCLNVVSIFGRVPRWQVPETYGAYLQMYGPRQTKNGACAFLALLCASRGPICLLHALKCRAAGSKVPLGFPWGPRSGQWGAV